MGDLLNWLEGEDSPAARVFCYSFFTMGFVYLAGHVLMALAN
jgi:hypothetical protein